MNKVLKNLLPIIMVMFTTLPSFAATPAGTVISNQATLGFTQEGVSNTVDSNITNFFVHEILDVSIVLSSANPVLVGSPDTRKYVSYVITNTGNGTQNFRLNAVNNISGDDFNPVFLNNEVIYVENGLSPDLQLTGINADILYVNQNLSILSNESKVIYVVADIPANLALNNLGFINLEVKSALPNSESFTVGQIISGIGAASTDVVVGPSLGNAILRGEFRISNLIVNMNKTIINEPTNPKTGDILRYRITIDVAGNGVANNIVISDPVPSGLSYVLNSTRLNGVNQTDVVDSDQMSFLTNTIRLEFPTITTPSNMVIEYSLSVN